MAGASWYRNVTETVPMGLAVYLESIHFNDQWHTFDDVGDFSTLLEVHDDRTCQQAWELITPTDLEPDTIKHYGDIGLLLFRTGEPDYRLLVSVASLSQRFQEGHSSATFKNPGWPTELRLTWARQWRLSPTTLHYSLQLCTQQGPMTALAPADKEANPPALVTLRQKCARTFLAHSIWADISPVPFFRKSPPDSRRLFFTLLYELA